VQRLLRTLRIGSVVAEAGTVVDENLRICQTAGGTETKIPVTLINGEQDGPTVNLHACIHGDEFEGVGAIWRIARNIKPKDLSGAIIATPIVHTSAYAAGTRESPIDGKDLARAFPGDPAGSATDRIAYYFFNEVVLKSDYVLGLHSGGVRYRFHPLVEYYSGLARNVDDKSKAMAEAFAVGPCSIVQRIPTPIRFNTCGYQSCIHGIPSIENEMWGEGRCLPEHVGQNVDSIVKVLEHLGMIKKGTATPHQAATGTRIPDHCEGLWVSATNGGFFVPKVQMRQTVEKDQEVGVITDDFGGTIEVVRAPTNGFVAAMRTFPMIQPGNWAVLVEKSVD
jgi:hypothetical protein